MAAMAALAIASAGFSYFSANSAQKQAREQLRKEEALLRKQQELLEERHNTQLGKLERHTTHLQAQAGKRDAMMEQAIMAGTRRTTSAETERQQGAAGLTGAARIRTAQAVAGAQAQGLLAVESTRQQREMELNKIVSANLQQAAQISQSGIIAEQQTKAQLEAARINADTQIQAAKMKKQGAIIGAVAGAATAFASSDVGSKWLKGLFSSDAPTTAAKEAMATGTAGMSGVSGRGWPGVDVSLNTAAGAGSAAASASSSALPFAYNAINSMVNAPTSPSNPGNQAPFNMRATTLGGFRGSMPNVSYPGGQTNPFAVPMGTGMTSGRASMPNVSYPGGRMNPFAVPMGTGMTSGRTNIWQQYQGAGGYPQYSYPGYWQGRYYQRGE